MALLFLNFLVLNSFISSLNNELSGTSFQLKQMAVEFNDSLSRETH